MDRRTEQALRTARAQLWDERRHDPDIHGMGVGMRKRGGERTDEPVVFVMVTKKRPAAYLSRSRLLPRTVDVDGESWGVDVIEAGPFSASLATAETDAEATE